MFNKLFLFVLLISSFYAHGAENSPGQEKIYVWAKRADGTESVGDIKAHYNGRFGVPTDKVTVIQKEPNISSDKSMQKDKCIPEIIETCKAASKGTSYIGHPGLKVIIPVDHIPLEASSITYYKTIVQALEQGMNVSNEENKILEKDIEYVVLIGTKKQ
jgi:hypothetical protein